MCYDVVNCRKGVIVTHLTLTLAFIMECIGVVSFSVSTSIIALRKQTDMVGAVIMSLLTSFGGGLTRDIIVGTFPPNLFWNEEYLFLAILCIAVTCICYHLFFIPKVTEYLQHRRHSFVLNLADAIGLSVFCVFGVDAAVTAQGNDNVLLLIFCGCISGVGGGILRDICSAEVPLSFRKHIYILPAVAGSTLYVLTKDIIPYSLSAILSVLFIIIFRAMAIVMRWNLPIPGQKRDKKE